MAEPFSFDSVGVAAAAPGAGFSFERAPVDPERVKSINEAIWHGVQSSATGLAARGKLPSQVLDSEAPWYHRVAANAAGVLSDLPLSAVAAVPGFAAGGPIGAGAAGFAAPMALRDALMEAYSVDHAVSWSDAWSIAKAGVIGGAKGAVIGAATMGAGKLVAPLVPGGALAKGVAATGAELATMTTTAAALEGHLPSAQDFMDNAILLGGLKGAVALVPKLRAVYGATGKTPGEVLADAAADPRLAAELKGEAVPPRFTKEEATARLKEIQPEIKALATKGDLTGAEAERFIALTNEFHEAQYDRGLTAGGLSDVAPAAERKSTLSPETNNVARADVLRDKDVYLALSESTAGVRFNADTAIDKVMLGENPKVTPRELYDAFANTRAALRAQYGETIPLWRAVGQQKEKATTNWATTEAFARQFGDNVVQKNVPVENVIAANVSKKGTYHELIIGEPPAATPKTGLPRAYEPLALEQRIKAAIENDPRPELIRQTLEANKAPDKIGDVAADHIRYEYIADKESAAGVLRATTELYQAEISKQTRGEVPNQQTAVEALKLISTGKLGEHIVGEAGNAAEIYARAHMLRGAANHAVAEMAKIADVPAADLTPAMKLQALAALERVAMLKAEIEGIGAEAGRSLQILGAIKRDPSFLGEAETLLKLAERKGPLQDIAALAKAFKDPAQMAAFARKYTEATTTEKVLEAWKSAILSGPQTDLANIMGNLVKWGIEIPESALAATFTAAERAIRGDPLTMAQYKARALAPLYGLQFGALDSLKVAAEVWNQKGDHLEKADVYRTAIQGKKGDVIRIPFRVLQVEDALFRTVAERSEAHIMAVDRAASEGILHPGTAEYNSQIQAWVQDPTIGPTQKAADAALARVHDAGAEAVFSQRLGPRMETLQRAMAGHWTQAIIPFVRTPANLVSWAIQHTPGFMLSGRWRADFMAGGEQQARAVSRVVIGTGLAMTAYSLAEQGLLTGGGIFDKEQMRTKQAAGRQPYSVNIGDKWYSYQRLEPIAKVLGLAADLVELSRSPKLDEGEQAKAVSMLVLMFGNATISTTYLSSLSNAMQSVIDPERYSENFMEQYAKSLVPKIIGQPTEMADPYKREVNGVLDAIQSQLPFLREKLLPKRDVWGEPVKSERLFAVMPVARTTQSDDLVRTEAMRLQVAISDAPKFIMESGPFNNREKRVKLQEEQRDIMREVSGAKAMEILAPIVNAPDWAQIPDFAKAAIYKDVIEGARKQGQYAALPPDAEARVKLREKIVNKIIEQSRKAQGE